MEASKNSANGSSPSPHTVAWGGAGMVSNTQANTRSGLPSAESRDASLFRNIQSEDLARHLDDVETMRVYTEHREVFGGPSTSSQGQFFDAQAVSDPDSQANDHAIASLLQFELNVEHDYQLHLKEKQMNKNSNLSINLDKHRLLPSLENDWSSHHPWQGLLHDDIGTHDYIKPIAFHTGKKKKCHKQDKVEKSTTAGHIDQRTAADLLSLLNSKMLKKLSGTISTGKEAHVNHAFGGKIEETELPKHCVVKIFKSVTGEFRTREVYIKDDPRFTNRMAETNHFKNILLWCEKEMRNMKRLHSAGVPCPKPIHHSGNVIIMSLIGDWPPNEDGHIDAAPQLNSLQMSQSQWADAYDQVIQIMKAMTNKCKLVHGDLSEFNLLYWNDTVYVIDFAQSMDLSHSRAMQFLYRDCINIANFFRRKGVPGVMTALETLQHITKIDFKQCSTDAEAVAKVESEIHLWHSSRSSEDYIFEFLWNAANGHQMAMKNAGIGISDDEEEDYQDDEEDGSYSSKHKDDWTAKRTDSSVIKTATASGLSTNTKKKKQRKNVSKAERNYASTSPGEVDGFFVVDPQDCCSSGIARSTEKSNLKRGQKVRFSDTDTAADTEDYNGGSDTDGVDADTTDVDTDFNAAEDCDTEGYHGDADDTDNYISDHNKENLSKEHRSKDKPHQSKSNSFNHQARSSSGASSRTQQQSVNSKRNHKKKNKKSTHRK